MSMHRRTAPPRPYLRSMSRWWRRDPYFVRYMVREATAVAVLAYAVVLCVGVVRLSQGEAAWQGWVAALQTPWSVLLHLVLLAAFVVHAKSWFDIMPKTLPLLFVHGRRVAGSTITRAGWAAVVVASVALLALAAWGAS